MSPHRIRCGPSCLWRGVCPRDIAISAIAALDCAFRRPRRLQPTTLPVAALWMAAPYHPVTRAGTKNSVSTILAATGPKADFAACHYPFRANPHPFAGRVVTGMLRAIFATASSRSFRSATPCTAPRCRQAARLWVSRSASATRSEAAMGRSIADRHPASSAGAVSLPGPDGFRHTPASTGARARGPCHYPGSWRVGSTCFPSPQLHIAQPSASVTVHRSTSITLPAFASTLPHAALPTCPASNSAPRASTAHAVSAFLFASATAAMFQPRRSLVATTQRLRRSLRPGALYSTDRAP